MTALHETECIAVRHGVLFSGRKDPAVVRHKKKTFIFIYQETRQCSDHVIIAPDSLRHFPISRARACACVQPHMSVYSVHHSHTYHSFFEMKEPSFWGTRLSGRSSGSYWNPRVLSSP